MVQGMREAQKTAQEEKKVAGQRYPAAREERRGEDLQDREDWEETSQEAERTLCSQVPGWPRVGWEPPQASQERPALEAASVSQSRHRHRCH